VDWMYIGQSRRLCLFLVKTVVEFGVPEMAGNLCNSSVNISFSRTILHRIDVLLISSLNAKAFYFTLKSKLFYIHISN
jgi:hypothetical protein